MSVDIQIRRNAYGINLMDKFSFPELTVRYEIYNFTEYCQFALSAVKYKALNKIILKNSIEL